MTKIVINESYGRFGLSKAAMRRYCELKSKFSGAIDIEVTEFGDEFYTINDEEIWDSFMARDDPTLIQVIEELGEAANGENAKLKIVEIPDDVKWYIDDNDTGYECIHEEHRTWD